MTDAPQPNTEAARPKGLDGVHWLSGLYTLKNLTPRPPSREEGGADLRETEAFKQRPRPRDEATPFPRQETEGGRGVSLHYS